MNPALIDDDTLLAYLDAQFDDEARYVAVEDALAAQPALRARLQALVDSVARPPRVRRATRPTLGSQQRRLESKSRRGGVKALRGRPHLGE